MAVIYHLPARYMGSHACREMTRRFADYSEDVQGVPATMFLKVENACIEWGGPRTKYRPRIALEGRPEKFVGKFPSNIQECRMTGPDSQQRVTYYYEFTRDNLSELAAKGIFEDGFQVPNIIRRATMELPCLCDFRVITLPKDEAELDPDKVINHPLVFLRVQDGSRPEELNTLVCYDDDSVINGRRTPGSGYHISEYFEFMPQGGYVVKAQPEALDDLDDIIERKDEKQADKQPVREMDVAEDMGYDLFEEQKQQQQTSEMTPETMPDPSKLTDPELRAVYEKMRQDAMEKYEARERRKKELRAKQLAEVVAEMQEAEEPLDIGDEPEPQPEPEEPKVPDTSSEDATRRQLVTTRNQAENIDTTEEFLEEGRSVNPRDKAVIDLEPEKVAEDIAEDVTKRKMPDTSGIVQDIADDVEKQLGQ